MIEPSPDPTLFTAIFEREALKLVKSYDFSDDVAVRLLSHSENTVLLIEDLGRAEKYVLRIHSHRLDYHREDMIASEVAWIRALRRQSPIETHDPVADREGRFVQILDSPELDRPRCAVIFTFLEGVEPDPECLSEGFVRLGGVTAHMHRQVRNWTLPPGFTRPTWSPDEIFANCNGFGPWQDAMGMDREALACLTRMVEVIGRRLSALGRDPLYFGLTHADFRLANTLIEGDSTKVIDYDDCGFSWFTYDLATALSFIQERPDMPELIEAWLEGYRAVAEMPAALEAEIASVIMLRRVAELAWLASRRYSEFSRKTEPGFTANSCRLAEDYLKAFG
ncbi:MAG: phosphotransferase [Alphaproteobacteria bacterium]|jgi:Ser/Thr protein kinase RdoA (MazF antagonist)|nr:phosphotransferase [Alphaproteobacteria bacterium]MDP6819386.1 phosphotransferase [Alphaproteobacteria bacterium]|tara:strand:- start:210 stop:1220 length:1011 start_codon:yes stop_codon:yes gene_type:complete